MADGDDDDLSFNDQQRAELADLHEQRHTSFERIAALLATELGLGDFAQLDEIERTQANDEATHAIERWAEDAETAAIPPEPVTPLQKLLKQHYDLGEQILDILDAAG